MGRKRLDEIPHGVFLLHGMAHGSIQDEPVVRPAATPFAHQITLPLEVREDPLGGALRDADPAGEVTHAAVLVARETDEGVSVVREERPRVGAARVDRSHLTHSTGLD